jgi:putative chromate ion transporter
MTPAPSLGETTRTFLRIGFLSFGGPAGQIALLHKVLVDEKKWLSESQFLHALSFCMLLPGPEAQQLATYSGWLVHGVRGGLIAGGLFVLPGLVLIIALSALYAMFGATLWLTGLFFGLKAAVLVVVAEAMVKVSKRALHGRFAWAIAIAAFLSLQILHLPFPVVIAGAGALGLLIALLQKRPTSEPASPLVALPWARLSLTLGLGLALWGLPFALGAIVPLPAILTTLTTFFSKLALFAFGGAYAALTYVAQQAVEGFHWLTPGQMIDGLALAETTPGPLVLVLSFVGFLASFQAATGWPPLLAGIAGAVLTAWAIFAPCFLWIFLGAPFIERLRGNAYATAALSAITAAVVGVIANLTVWFALHVLFAQNLELSAWGLHLTQPVLASLDLMALVLAALAFVIIFLLKWGLPPALCACALAGLALKIGF